MEVLPVVAPVEAKATDSNAAYAEGYRDRWKKGGSRWVGRAEKHEFTKLVYSHYIRVDDTANYEPGSASPAVAQTRIPIPHPWGVK